jgi:hypothetical protein
MMAIFVTFCDSVSTSDPSFQLPIPLLVASLTVRRNSFTKRSHQRLVETESNYSIGDGKTGKANKSGDIPTSKTGLGR